MNLKDKTMQATTRLTIVTTLLIAMASVSAPGLQTSTRGTITVTITSLRSNEGEILISLYNKAEGFPRDRNAVIQAEAIAPDGSGQVTAYFKDFPYGDYAVAVLHDEDLSSGMTFGAFHLPKEGYCFSNNVKVKFKPPKFKKAKFTLDSENVTQILRMRY